MSERRIPTAQEQLQSMERIRGMFAPNAREPEAIPIEAWIVERLSKAGDWIVCHGGTQGTRFFTRWDDVRAESDAWVEDGYTVRVSSLIRYAPWLAPTPAEQGESDG